MTKEYIAYRGDRPLGTGTIRELAEKLGFTYKNMQFRTYPSTHKKMGNGAILLYEIEEDDEDDS